MKKGFIQLAPILIVGAIILSGIVGGFVGAWSQKQNNLGATVITTNLSDTIGTLRTNINTSLTNLNDAITSTTSSVTVGNASATSLSITNPCSIASGCTGTSSYTYGVVIGSGTTKFSTIVPSTSSYVLTSDGATWVSSSSLAGNTLIAASTTNVVVNNTVTTTTLLSVTIPANVLVGNNNVYVDVNFTTVGQNASDTLMFRLNYGGTTVASGTIVGDGVPSTGRMFIHASIQAVSSIAQEGTMFISVFDQVTSTAGFASITKGAELGSGLFIGSGAVSATSSQTLALTAVWQNALAANTLTMENYTVYKIINQ